MCPCIYNRMKRWTTIGATTRLDDTRRTTQAEEEEDRDTDFQNFERAVRANNAGTATKATSDPGEVSDDGTLPALQVAPVGGPPPGVKRKWNAARYEDFQKSIAREETDQRADATTVPPWRSQTASSSSTQVPSQADLRKQAEDIIAMAVVKEPNVQCLSAQGTFDDCKKIVKALFSELDLKEKYGLSEVNTLDWARIMLQIKHARRRAEK